MMASRITPGTCLLCRTEVNKKKSLNHTAVCLQSSGWPAGLLPSFIIRAEDSRDPSYWLMILARHGAQAGDLDHLLRDVWMESGTKPSSFTIRNTLYHSSGNGMDVPLVNLLEKGDSFSYEYDMDMHTNLRLRVEGTTMVMPPDGSLCLLARNNPSFPRCSVCGADAQYVASKTGDDETAEYYCLNCLMDLGEAFVQLIENSPRKSVCASPENLNEMIKWYPPGWEIKDLASPEMFAFMMAGEDNDEDYLRTACREELKPVAQTDWPPEEVLPEDIFGGSLNALIENNIRCGMIAQRCEDFCTRFENEDVLERCREIVSRLGAHPNRPLSRGDVFLWSAAIVYAACREEKIIGKAKGGSPLAQEICAHFNRELSSVRGRVTVLRKRLAECPDEEFPFTI